MRLLQRTLALLRQDAEGQIHDRAGRYSSGIQTRAERTISLKSPGCYVHLDHGIRTFRFVSSNGMIRATLPRESKESVLGRLIAGLWLHIRRAGKVELTVRNTTL